MSYKIEKHTIDGVLDWYQLQDCVNWVIYHKKPEYIKHSYKKSDADEGLEHLHHCLRDLKGDSTNTNDYVLRCDTKTKTDKEKPHLIFKLNTDTQSVGSFPGQYQPTNEILSRLNAIEAKLIDEEIDELEEDQPRGTESILAGFLQKPEVQNMVIAALTGIASSFMAPKVTAVSGVKEDQLDDILQTLFNKGVKVEHLRKLAEMPQAKIQMLIGML
jgi:hypothetical protein